MGWLTQRLRSFSIVGLDTAIFIYHFESNPTYLPFTHELFSSIEMGKHKGVTSTITLMELIVKPLSLGHIGVARKYEAMLVNFPNLEVVDLDRDVIRQAARLRGRISNSTSRCFASCSQPGLWSRCIYNQRWPIETLE